MAIIDLSVTMIDCGSLAGSHSQISRRSLLVCCTPCMFDSLEVKVL
jgi:hypothetical protein